MMRTCDGTGCKVKMDCVRYIERARHPMGERYPSAPWKWAPVVKPDATLGRGQVCAEFRARESVTG